jgi:hypothetical protein
VNRHTTAPPPSGISIRCGQCRYWHAALAAEVILVNGQPVPKKDYEAGKAAQLKAGLPITPHPSITLVETRQAPCILNPQWVMQPDDGYCFRGLPVDPLS